MGTLIGFCADFYAAAPQNKFLMVGLVWLLWPGLMFLVGVIGESRLVPVWKHQSKAFIPGELLIGVALVALLGMHAERADGYYYSAAYWLYEVMVFVWLYCFVIRKKVRQNYPARSAISPTKITHDVVGFILIPTALCNLWLPKLFDWPSLGDLDLPKLLVWPPLYSNKENWIIFLVAMAGYILCIVADIKIGYTEEDIQARHPSDWKPIWVTLRERW